MKPVTNNNMQAMQNEVFITTETFKDMWNQDQNMQEGISLNEYQIIQSNFKLINHISKVNDQGLARCLLLVLIIHDE